MPNKYSFKETLDNTAAELDVVLDWESEVKPGDMYLSVSPRGKVEQVTTCRSCEGENVYPKETYGYPTYQEYCVKIKG